MEKRQFGVLFREFLFRMVDLELLSTEGDITDLLGRFAAMLTFASSVLGFGGMLFDGHRMRPEALLAAMRGMQSFLFSTTMLVVGIFAVLSWDSAFPDRRDVMVLAPMPIRPRTMFLAKAAAIAVSLGLVVVALNGISGTIWAMHFGADGSGVVGLFRAQGAFWITVLAGGTFIFCSVLGLQGIAAQLPRRHYLRLSGLLQLGAFGLLLCGFFMTPTLIVPQQMLLPENQRFLVWVPTYWFFGLFQQLNDTTHPVFAHLAMRAIRGTAIAAAVAAMMFLLSYLRTIRKIVEEPDIVPGTRGGVWLPPFGNRLHTAVVQFSIRTLLRSRQHRMILSFYLGVGFAAVTLFLKSGDWRAHAFRGIGSEANAAVLLGTVAMLGTTLAGMRVVFAMPLEAKANWVFQVMPLRGAAQCLSATRRALLLLSVAPVWWASAVVLLAAWPWRAAAGHLAILGLAGLAVTEIVLLRFQKIPFTCSYMPGKAQMHLAFVASFFGLFALMELIDDEIWLLARPWPLIAVIALFAAGVAATRRWNLHRTRKDAAKLQFEEEAPVTILALGIGKG